MNHKHKASPTQALRNYPPTAILLVTFTETTIHLHGKVEQ